MARLFLCGVVFADLFSAYIHLTLVPEHLVEVPLLGVAFAIAAALLVICASVLLLDRARTTVLRLNGALLIALIVSYVISRVIGVPVIGEGTEPVEAVGVVTQFAQAAGLFCIVAALRFEFRAVPYTQLSSSRKDSL